MLPLLTPIFILFNQKFSEMLNIIPHVHTQQNLVYIHHIDWKTGWPKLLKKSGCVWLISQFHYKIIRSINVLAKILE